MGVLYGSKHFSTLSAREVELREIEAKQKVIRDAQLAKEKKVMDRGEFGICLDGGTIPVPSSAFDRVTGRVGGRYKCARSP